MSPRYTLDKIKFATDAPTFEKAVALFEGGKVKNFKEGISSYTATVQGTKSYHVFVEARQYGLGDCDCYLGQNNTLCKHMVAVAIYAVMDGKSLSVDDKKQTTTIQFSGKLGILNPEELSKIKKEITNALRYVKAYLGPSRTWFAYQNSLQEGCNRLAAIISSVPASEQTAKFLISLFLRLDKKLSEGGVDDSDGTVGNFMGEVVDVLVKFAEADPMCSKAFKELRERETCFDWKEPLLKFMK